MEYKAIEAKLNAGLSKEEAKIARKRLAELGIGWYRTKAKLINLQAKLRKARSSGNQGAIQEAQADLNNIMGENAQLFENMCEDLTGLFRVDAELDDEGQPIPPPALDANGEEVMDTDGQVVPNYEIDDDGNQVLDKSGKPVFVKRDIITVPTFANPSTAHYLTTLALILPMAQWTNVAYHKKSINIVRGILSSDKRFSRHNNLGSWVSEKEKENILSTFNNAVNKVESFLQNANHREKEAFDNQWLAEQRKVQESFFPVSSSHSPLVFHRLLQHAFLMSVEDSDSDSDSDSDDITDGEPGEKNYKDGDDEDEDDDDEGDGDMNE